VYAVVQGHLLTKSRHVVVRQDGRIKRVDALPGSGRCLSLPSEGIGPDMRVPYVRSVTEELDVHAFDGEARAQSRLVRWSRTGVGPVSWVSTLSTRLQGSHMTQASISL
jgi:hypothetical protein